jgi:hypothetical protein
MPLSLPRRFVACFLVLVVSLSSSSLVHAAGGISYRYRVECPKHDTVQNDGVVGSSSQSQSSQQLLWGYTSLRDLNLEMRRHASQVSLLRQQPQPQQGQPQSQPSNKNRNRRLYTYTLCPKTIFDADSSSSLEYDEDNNNNNNFQPVAPILSGTVIQCGRDGDSRDDCIIQGGGTQVLMVGGEEQEQDDMDDDEITLFVFRGITFRQSHESSVAALRSNTTRAEFVDCHWRVRTTYFCLIL